MLKDIKIGDKTVAFKSSAALPILYRQETGRDFFHDMQNMEESGESMLDIAFTMHKHAEPEEALTMTEWLAQFEFAEFQTALADLVTMLVAEQATSVTPKKRRAQ